MSQGSHNRNSISLFLYTSVCSVVYVLLVGSDYGTYPAFQCYLEQPSGTASPPLTHSNCSSIKSFPRMLSERLIDFTQDELQTTYKCPSQGARRRTHSGFRKERTPFEAAQPLSAKSTSTVRCQGGNDIFHELGVVENSVTCRSLR
jgi:hypothetical protein